MGGWRVGCSVFVSLCFFWVAESRQLTLSPVLVNRIYVLYANNNTQVNWAVIQQQRFVVRPFASIQNDPQLLLAKRARSFRKLWTFVKLAFLYTPHRLLSAMTALKSA